MVNGTRIPRVVVVGAGFSGMMTAVHLRRAGAEVTCIDRSGRWGEGLAYSTNEAAHRLNVPAACMSAFADEPAHFAAWLADRDGSDGASFATRTGYRAYLNHVLDEVRDHIRFLRDDAVAVGANGVALSSGETVIADAVVLASGNLPPATIGVLAASSLAYVDDPWPAAGRKSLVAMAGQERDVLIVGTGLTMIDTVLSLVSHGFEGRIVAVSRRGQLPRAHGAMEAAALDLPERRRPRDVLRWVRRHARTMDWRVVVDALRPVTADIWRGWTRAERGSFLRHLRPWWDVHRHRIAPDVAKRLQGMIEGGRLQVLAARIDGVGSDEVVIRRRGEATGEAICVAGVVNCTGPRGDIRRSGDRLIEGLLASGAARADAFGLGFDVDADCRVLGADGRATRRLYAVGPMTKGVFWEVVAVPDIRGQAARVAGVIMDDLANAQPVLASAA